MINLAAALEAEAVGWPQVENNNQAEEIDDGLNEVLLGINNIMARRAWIQNARPPNGRNADDAGVQVAVIDFMNNELQPRENEVDEFLEDMFVEEGVLHQIEEANPPLGQPLEDRVRELGPERARGFLNDIHLQPMPNAMVLHRGNLFAAARAPFMEHVVAELRTMEIERQNELPRQIYETLNDFLNS